MEILVINCGSSSIKTTVINLATGVRLVVIKIDGIGEAACTLHINGLASTLPAGLDYDDALTRIFAEIERFDLHIDGVGHRVVHGGEQFSQPTLIETETEAAIEALVPLAPLHNPACLAGIHAARRLLPQLPQVAVFDTAFHSTLPKHARAYALPQKVVDKLGIRRYGFHGISHEYVAQRASEFLSRDLSKLRLIACHLGNGCSIAAIEHGRSVETSMGMTPLEGLVMGTRCGDIDPGVVMQLQRAGDLSVDELDKMLNHSSGLLGMTGVNDMREIEVRAAQGDESASLAIQVFTHRIRKYIGAYAAVMGGVDAIVFMGGIGEHSSLIRHRVAQGLDFLGVHIDEHRNRNLRIDRNCPVAEFSASHSPARLLVVATDEAQLIAERTAQTIDQSREKGSRRTSLSPTITMADAAVVAPRKIEGDI
ncbi:acetate kinase [Dasania marina]|uniref:acetate/propionate family kinase n=1 Tax=Dasania marina TaxID=471499 RepID=UPI0030DA37EF|tara:strand:+ start:7554 stop:8825 length:1272 start_codon:yes stop_codon:yes gene_type:complete